MAAFDAVFGVVPTPLSFCSLRAQTGSLRILAAFRTLFQGGVRPLYVEDNPPQYPLNFKQKLFTASGVSRLSTSPTTIATARCPLSPVIILLSDFSSV